MKVRHRKTGHKQERHELTWAQFKREIKALGVASNYRLRSIAYEGESKPSIEIWEEEGETMVAIRV